MIKTNNKTKNRLGDEHEPSPLHLRRLKSQHHDFSSSTIHPPHPPLLMASLPRRALGYSILLPHTSSDGLVASQAPVFRPPPFPRTFFPHLASLLHIPH